MKTLLFILVFTLCAGLGFANKVTIVNSGFIFSPDSVKIGLTDTVIFQLASIHDVIEVSPTTWNSNGNTPLPGGFSLPFGGGQLTGLRAGVHFYVCGPHASLGMKGIIYVSTNLGINGPMTSAGKAFVFPNPTRGRFTLQYLSENAKAGLSQDIRLEIYDLSGNKVISRNDILPQASYEFDLGLLPDGTYFLTVIEGKKSSTVKILKR